MVVEIRTKKNEQGRGGKTEKLWRVETGGEIGFTGQKRAFQ